MYKDISTPLENLTDTVKVQKHIDLEYLDMLDRDRDSNGFVVGEKSPAEDFPSLGYGLGLHWVGGAAVLDWVDGDPTEDDYEDAKAFGKIREVPLSEVDADSINVICRLLQKQHILLTPALSYVEE